MFIFVFQYDEEGEEADDEVNKPTVFNNLIRQTVQS